MRAHTGDRVIVRSRRVGGNDRSGKIVEVRGYDGRPPYVVRWAEDGHEGLFVPGPDTTIEPESPTQN